MGKIKKNPAGHRGGDARDRNGARGSDDERWDQEDDPFRDLRPHDDEMRNPSSDEYMWPDMTDEYEDDD